MKKIIGYAVIVSACLALSIFGRGRTYILQFDALVRSDSTAESLSFAPDSGRILVSSGTRNVLSPIHDKSLVGTIIVGASTTTASGLGLSDTVIITLSTSMNGLVTQGLDSVKTIVPGTLYVAYGDAVADTLLKQSLIVSWRIYDTAGGLDGIIGATYPITITAIGKD